MPNEVTIVVKAEGTQQAVRDVQGLERTMTQSLKGIGASIAGTALGFGVFQASRVLTDGVTSALKSAVQSAEDFNRMQAQTAAVLKSTSGVAGVTAEQVRSLAANLEQLSGVDENVIQGAENVLLTFTNIGKDVFPTATQAILDMSVALGTDLQSTTIQVGKALQDPILGVTALRRVGVNFNETQQEMLKGLVENGKAAEAQAFILKELQNEFGGSAKAAEDARGGVNRHKDAMEDAARNLAQRYLPGLHEARNSLFELGAQVLTSKGFIVALDGAFAIAAKAAREVKYDIAGVVDVLNQIAHSWVVKLIFDVDTGQLEIGRAHV